MPFFALEIASSIAQVNAKAALEFCSIWNKKLRPAAAKVACAAFRITRTQPDSDVAKWRSALQNSIQIDLYPVTLTT